MIEKGKISSLQMAMLLYFIVLATAILTLPSVAGKDAKQDLWLSPIWASLIGFLTLGIFLKLNKFYPNENIIQYSERIIGKLAGKTLGFIYLFFHLYLNGIVLRQYAEFIANFLPKTPIPVVIASMVLVCMFVVYGGVEVLARATQVFLPLFILPLLLMVLLLLPDIEIDNIFPIMGNGILPSLQGATSIQSWFNDFFYISFFLPFLKDRSKARKLGVISIVAVVLTMVITNLITLLVLGSTTQEYIYPVISVSRYISIANFFEHVESMVMAVWVTGIFVKVSAIYYVLTLGTAQCLNVRDYKPFVLPFGFLQVIVALWISSNFQQLVSFLSTSGIVFFFSLEIVIPLFLLLIAFIKKRRNGGLNSNGTKNQKNH
ncbi:spore gernimation protein [Priestia megaterium]|uniref:GerAB/ArcD/ProY family transporter n=1 Tax=Priestia megaterium TaxID=1404 RepID=UPI000BEB2E35|nr:endospore germination permease [Priestia megaterium]PEB64613.1 spore gernimation protein [Priestia megaterium]